MKKLFARIGILVVIAILLSYSIIPTCYFKIRGTPNSKISTEEKYLCLTFDDGPDEEYTRQLLDILNKYNIKATFFVVADNAKKYPEIIEQIKSEGHLVELHSLEHKNELLTGPMYTNENFKESLAIMNKLNVNIKYYRPPKGNVNLFTIFNVNKYNLKLILWDLSIGDWKESITADEISGKLLKKVENKDVICLHDKNRKDRDPKKTIEALDKVLPIWISEGYKFLRVDEVYE